MEKQKNRLQFVKNEATLLPIEEEFVLLIKGKIESKLNCKVNGWKKYYTHPLYDCFLFVADNRPFFLKINLSPDVPNSWMELWSNNFSFHPKIVCHSESEDEFKFLCFEVPKGTFLSDLSNYPLSPKLNIQRSFANLFKDLHSIKLSTEDKTVDVFNSFLPKESLTIFKTYPVVDVFSTAKIIFKQAYKENIDHCGLCHFDFSSENIIYTGEDLKIINFEYSANANIYLDMWLAKQILNCSDIVFDNFLSLLPEKYSNNILIYKDLSYLFNFAYFNSKIISEYMTFGLRNPPKLKYWINQSKSCYINIQDKLFVQKDIDKLICDFYYLWH